MTIATGDWVEFLGDDDAAADVPEPREPWRVLIVDDDPDVHRATEFALRGVRVLERPLEFLHAETAARALALLRAEADVAVILLDVVMETDDAGLAMVRVVREELGLQEVRIILRTGQPGYAPEIETICNYDINDYKTKNELTRTRLLTAVIAAIRSYDQLRRLEGSRRGLRQIVQACNDFISYHGIRELSAGVIAQLGSLLALEAPDGLVCTSADGADALACATVVAATGTCAGLLDRRLDEIADPAVAGPLRQALVTEQHVLGPHQVTLHVTGRNDRAIAVHVRSPAALHSVDEHLLQVFCSNVAICYENVELLAELRENAYTDRLLKLPNRLAFIERIEALRAAGALEGKAVALLDVDQFSEVNDMFGHAYGDRLLQAIAQRLVERVGTRCVVARVAGDVFGVLGDESLVQPRVLMPVFDEPFASAGTEYDVSVSIGLVRLTGYAGSGADLLKDASIAIKRGKSGGQGQSVYFSDAIAQESRRRARLLADLRHAFQFGRLYMAFQPQIDFATGSIVGLEALMRWPGAEGEQISPDLFIPIAEQSGLIVELGAWALRASLRMCGQLKRAGIAVRMAVNVSPVQFRHPAFLDTLDQALAECGASGDSLELEITESVAMTGSSDIERALHGVRARGVTVAIDDFGTGYSSLAYLDRLPVDRIKIDKAFIRPLAGHAPDTRIVEMVIALSHKLGMTVLAEGVELEEQATLLRRLGCDEAQGYLYGKPMTPEALLHHLGAH